LTPVPVLDYRLRVTHTSEARMSGAFMVTRTSTNTCNSVASKSSVKIVKYVEFLANVYSAITGNVVRSCLHQNCIIAMCCINK